MRMTAAAAIGALILAAGAAPAFAGGYWDGGIVQGGPAVESRPAYADQCCPCGCPRVREDDGDRERRGWSDARDYGEARAWSDERDFDSGWRDDDATYEDRDEDDYGPADYSDSGYGVGPAEFYDYYGGGGGGGGGFAGAGAFSGAGAFANVGVDVSLRDHFHDHFHDHDMFHDHDRSHFHDHDHDMSHHDHHMAYAPQMSPMGGHGYAPHVWGAMQPHAGGQVHMMGGHVGGFSHPAMHSGGMHGGGGRRR